MKPFLQGVAFLLEMHIIISPDICLYLSMSTYIVTPTAEQEKLMAEFLESQHISFIKDENDIIDLPGHVLDGIKKGEEGYEAGRYTSFDEFKKKL